MEIRSFLAFELPPDIKKELGTVLAAQKKLPLDLKWVKPDNVHLTVVFMGNVPQDNLAPMGDVVKGVCGRFAPFHVKTGRVGFFGSRRHPRVLWMGFDGDIRRMGHLRDALQKKLKPFGIKKETRPYRPHLTLGRFRKGARPWPHLDYLMEAYKDSRGPACVLNELAMFKSDLKPGGAVYTKLNAWSLEGAEKS